ncbi:MAG: glycoside hydrolase family 20 zincin-like fold domain-containing protein [Victivallaceae bacterium]|nr:glycoside hydrolase family 20 zincin-like fold domain-containing protein [Victivallaceae bacterium]
MMNKIKRLVTLVLTLATICLFSHKSFSMPDLVPMPKQYKATGGTFMVSGQPIFIVKGNRQCEIAAEELALRIRELGGRPGRIMSVDNGSQSGIYLLPVMDKTAGELKRELSLKITRTDPGPQGYLIRTLKDRIVIIGSDNVGTLYGAMTLRQMMEQDKTGNIYITSADVDDKPDYRYRCAVRAGKKYEAGTTEGIDLMMRFKINILDYMFKNHGDIRSVNPVQRKAIKMVNRYAVERGVYPSMFCHTKVGTPSYDKIDPKSWDGIYNYSDLYSYYRFDLHAKYIARSAEFFREHNFKMLFLHPVDGGGIKNPSHWNDRSPTAKKMWKDNERWKPMSKIYNMWYKAIKDKEPEAIISICQYPYSAIYGNPEFWKSQGVSDRTGRAVSIDYWKQLNKTLPTDIRPLSWTYLRHGMKVFNSCFKDRPIAIYQFCLVPIGFFPTFSRFIKTSYLGNPEDISYLSWSLPYTSWMNYLCFNEYSWNVNAPGSAEIKGKYILYNPDRDHSDSEPEEIINDWLPRACRAFFGKEVGDRITPLYQSGIQHRYILGNADRLFNRLNRLLFDTEADADPTRRKTDLSKQIKKMKGRLVDSSDRMAKQVKATAKAMEALAEAYKYIDTLGAYQRRIFIHYFRRAPYWHACAIAKYAVKKALELQRESRFNKAKQVLKQGLADYEHARAEADKIAAATASEPDMYIVSRRNKPLGDIMPSVNKIEASLRDSLKSATLALSPRMPGKYLMVGIFKGVGAKSTKAFFDGFSNVKAKLIGSLALNVLDRFDCVFMLQTSKISEQEAKVNLVRYVKEGGGAVLFQHDLCGRGGRSVFGNSTPFPQISPKSKGSKVGKKLRVVKPHALLPGLKQGEQINHMYYDHIMPVQGKDGVVLVRDKDGEAVIIAGEYEHGKVVFDGTINLLSDKKEDKDAALQGINKVIARGFVEWATGVKLIRKK